MKNEECVWYLVPNTWEPIPSKNQEPFARFSSLRGDEMNSQTVLYVLYVLYVLWFGLNQPQLRPKQKQVNQ